MKKILAEISLGELVDKISILMIKQKNIKETSKLENVNKELDSLNNTLTQYIKEQELNNYLNTLIDINTKLWNIEDDIRKCERLKKFDQTFIDLARSVYFTNDERAKIKNDINRTFGSELVEVKSYDKY